MCVSDEEDDAMVDEQTGAPARTRKQKYKDWMEFLILMAAFMTVIGGGLASALWWGFADNVKSEAAEFLGVDTIATQVADGFQKVDSEISALRVQVTSNAKTIQGLAPAPRVAEADPKRSRIYSPCAVGAVCNYQVRVRRTEFGGRCAKPVVLNREVVDIAGTYHPVAAGPNTKVNRISREWTLVPASFYTPSSAALGFAEYVMTLSYDCPGETIIEQIVLPFDIIRAERGAR